MANECNVSKIVTSFLLNTCRLPPPPSKEDYEAALCCGLRATDRPPSHKEERHIPVLTGSIAEFYIKPMLPHIGDVDVMFYRNGFLAIPRGRRPPTQLPAEFHNFVHVFEITDSHLPGYVYLPLRYLLTKCSDDDSYNYIELYNENQSLRNHEYEKVQGVNYHGPALFTDNSHTKIMLSSDTVPCVRCLVWPIQAADWPTRPCRNYGWPDSATVDRVVSNGCDVVQVAHRQCRQHKWMGMLQHRLSCS